jgi:hypothetical protein
MDLLPPEKQQLAANLWKAVTSLLAQELAQAAQGVYASLVTLLPVKHLAVMSCVSCSLICFTDQHRTLFRSHLYLMYVH